MGLRQEAGDKVRVTIISSGMVRTEGVINPEGKAGKEESRDKFTMPAEVIARAIAIAMPPEAIARAIAYAIEQPADIDVNEIVIRPTAQA